MSKSLSEAFASPQALADTLMDLPTADHSAMAQAQAHQALLAKPPGALGRLEEIAVFLAGWQQTGVPRADHPHILVFAGNHGVAQQGVSPYPPAVTAIMTQAFAQGGAAINAIAGSLGAGLTVHALALDRPTMDFTQAAAMQPEECLQAMRAGAEAVPQDCDILCVGEMGIGNTTVAAALSAAVFGGDGVDWAGPGTGLGKDGVAHKAAVVDDALARHKAKAVSAFELLRRLGGRELAAIAGAVVAARLRRLPVLLDGYVATAAVAPLLKAHPAALDHCLSGHMSLEPGHRRLLEKLRLRPLLALEMRLGEGTGAALSLAIVRAAVACHAQMARLDSLGIALPPDGDQEPERQR